MIELKLNMIKLEKIKNQQLPNKAPNNKYFRHVGIGTDNTE